MTPTQEAAIWRTIGAGFERVGNKLPDALKGRAVFVFGLCLAADLHGLPSYDGPGSRVSCVEGHRPYAVNFFAYTGARREAAFHRAMSAYLMAEVVADGRAPGGPDDA